ncbi:hypothetical protein T265_10552 [Opisthorchis viverrini]|uniref:Uncharacterized protein n=1 Tax=Opisthorchis viverrini TaxID=6198 RepID=A0A074Z646_OPIVI|nr:hypothetical protein T265_10552 [Opisthorchis viverrini]KER21027.1 hypothetical protein T265_10552 [Opisthorchis viverrini]
MDKTRAATTNASGVQMNSGNPHIDLQRIANECSADNASIVRSDQSNPGQLFVALSYDFVG